MVLRRIHPQRVAVGLVLTNTSRIPRGGIGQFGDRHRHQIRVLQRYPDPARNQPAEPLGHLGVGTRHADALQRRPFVEAGQQGVENRLLGRERPVQAGAGDADPLADVTGTDGRKALCTEQAGPGGQQRLVAGEQGAPVSGSPDRFQVAHDGRTRGHTAGTAQQRGEIVPRQGEVVPAQTGHGAGDRPRPQLRVPRAEVGKLQSDTGFHPATIVLIRLRTSARSASLR